MKAHFPVLSVSVSGAIVLCLLLTEPVTAQYGRTRGSALQGGPWENNRVRVSQLSVEPDVAIPTGSNQVLVYLTAGPDGRMPAEAVWEPAGGDVRNRGPARVEAIAIELKDVSDTVSRGTPPEALNQQDGISVTTLIDNPHVLVAKHRYDPSVSTGPWHFHTEDVLVVYLRGGHGWPANGFWGASRIRRGDVDVIPANTLHRLGNAGGDPLELLVIVPR